jgi:hypothetical protein
MGKTMAALWKKWFPPEQQPDTRVRQKGTIDDRIIDAPLQIRAQSPNLIEYGALGGNPYYHDIMGRAYQFAQPVYSN